MKKQEIRVYWGLRRANLCVWSSISAHRIIVAWCLLVTTPSRLVPPVLIQEGSQTQSSTPQMRRRRSASDGGGMDGQAGNRTHIQARQVNLSYNSGSFRQEGHQ